MQPHELLNIIYSILTLADNSEISPEAYKMAIEALEAQFSELVCW